MDKITKYQDLIRCFLTEMAESKPINIQNIENKVIIDIVNNHYQLLRQGWDGPRYVMGICFHFDIKNEKIWIQLNATDILVADYFTERGVPKSDIVLGFQPEYARPYTGFATA